jgi:hypothetical protein
VLTSAQLVAAVDEHVRVPGQDWGATSDLLLIGSRALGFADPSSDYDLVLLTDEDIEQENVAFRARPGAPEISVAVCGPSARADKESANLAEWVYDITHARLLRQGTGIALSYQSSLARLWGGRRAEEIAGLRADANSAVRLAASALRHEQILAAHLALGRALYAAMNLIVTINETGRPGDKWLPLVVSGLAPHGSAVLKAADKWCQAGSEPEGVAAALGSLNAVLRGLPLLLDGREPDRADGSTQHRN